MATAAKETIPEAIRNPLSVFDVKGRSYVVTGATGAIGRTCSILLAAQGANVTVTGGNKAELEELAQEIADLKKGKVEIVNKRPKTEVDCKAIMDVACDKHNGVDGLFVASGYNKAGFIHEMPQSDWEDVIDANLRQTWLICREYGRRAIAQQRGGKCVLMSSVRGRHGNISGYTAYCISKAGIDGLTHVLATEWAKHKITCNAIAPTVFRSKLTAWMYGDDELGQATKARSLSRIPLGRLGEPEDFVGILLYLLSPASNFTTGQVMYIDGGFTAG
jgi:NAD(P)-dependent dehydrogenase (short-subunit alcohol dehydrogenase family)